MKVFKVKITKKQKCLFIFIAFLGSFGTALLLQPTKLYSLITIAAILTAYLILFIEYASVYFKRTSKKRDWDKTFTVWIKITRNFLNFGKFRVISLT